MAEIQILVVEKSKTFADAISGEIRSRLCFGSVIAANLEETKKLLEEGPVLVDFWATWCEPCKKEMRFLNKFHNKYENFNVLAINEDKTRSISRVKSYIRSRNYDFYVGLDPSGQIFKELNALAYPTNILIDKDGTVLWRHQGYLPGDEKNMENAIKDAVSKYNQ